MKILIDGKILKALKCPHCNGSLSLVEGTCASLVCDGAKRHCFDLSSSGYVNFAPPAQSGGGDSPDAVRARESFLSRGFYEKIREAVYEAALEYGVGGGLLVDAGCGEGYYSQRMGESFCVFGADISKSAVNIASKRAKREGADKIFYSVASVFSLPIKDKSATVVTNIFAPCVEAEYGRILDDDGALIVAYAGEEHLSGLKSVLYDNVRKNQERADMPVNMERVGEKRVRFNIRLENQEDIKSLFAMTPYYWRTSIDDAQRLYGLNELETEIDVIVAVYKKRKDGEKTL